MDILSTFPVLETENLVLREINLSDAEAVFQFFSDKEVLKYHDVEAFTTLEQAEKLIDRWQNKFKIQKNIRWGIAQKENNIIIGTCGCSPWIEKPLGVEIGYELAQIYWQKGIMSEALKAIIKFGFEERQVNRIQATVMLGNIASMKLLEKLGFSEEGVLREYGFWKGEFHDLKMFSLLKRDYLN